jgi:type IV secretion system protein VirD4
MSSNMPQQPQRSNPDKIILLIFGTVLGAIIVTKVAFGLAMLLSHGKWLTPSSTGLQAWAHLRHLSAVTPKHNPPPPEMLFIVFAILLAGALSYILFFLVGHYRRVMGLSKDGSHVASIARAYSINAVISKARYTRPWAWKVVHGEIDPLAVVRGEVDSKKEVDKQQGGDSKQEAVPEKKTRVTSKRGTTSKTEAASKQEVNPQKKTRAASKTGADSEQRVDPEKDNDEVNARKLKERLKAELKSPLGVGLYVGRSSHGDLWASVEDSFVAIGPPRQGKSTGIVIPRLKEWPGAAVVTSVRNDVELATVDFRKTDHRAVLSFDPEFRSKLPRIRFSLVRGCENPLVAQRRASLLLSQMSTSSGKENDFWSNSAQAILRILLLIAAESGREFDSVMQWLKSPQELTAKNGKVQEVFQQYKNTIPKGWDEELKRMVGMQAKETSEGIMQTAVAALEAFVNPDLLDQLSPRGAPKDPDAETKDQQTDLKEFLRNRGTLYITASENVQKAIAPVIVVLITEIIEAAKQIASEYGRMDPPLLLALDEVANIAPIPNLAEIYSVAGGSGITMLSILQTTAQAKKRWGTDGFQALWGATTVRIILGGVTDMETLKEMAALAGTKTETQISYSTSDQGSSTSTSTVERERMKPEDFYSLSPGEAMVVGKGQPPIKVKTGPAPEKYWPSVWRESETSESEPETSESQPQSKTKRLMTKKLATTKADVAAKAVAKN